MHFAHFGIVERGRKIHEKKKRKKKRRKKRPILICLCFNMVSFRGQKKFGPRPDRSPLGV